MIGGSRNTLLYQGTTTLFTTNYFQERFGIMAPSYDVCGILVVMSSLRRLLRKIKDHSEYASVMDIMSKIESQAVDPSLNLESKKRSVEELKTKLDVIMSSNF
jgi:hypothetical protein